MFNVGVLSLLTSVQTAQFTVAPVKCPLFYSFACAPAPLRDDCRFVAHGTRFHVPRAALQPAPYPIPINYRCGGLTAALPLACHSLLLFALLDQARDDNVRLGL